MSLTYGETKKCVADIEAYIPRIHDYETYTDKFRSQVLRSLNNYGDLQDWRLVTFSFPTPREGVGKNSMSWYAYQTYLRSPHYYHNFPRGTKSKFPVVKVLAAIVQICYGCFELYEARGPQIDRFGYAAYSFTVIPYVLMLFLNFIGSLSCPMYSSMYLVHYGVQEEEEAHECTRELEHLVSGAVGCAHLVPPRTCSSVINY